MSLEREFGYYSAIEATWQQIEAGIATSENPWVENFRELTVMAIKNRNIKMLETVIEQRSRFLEICSDLIDSKEEILRLREENLTLKEAALDLKD